MNLSLLLPFVATLCAGTLAVYVTYLLNAEQRAIDIYKTTFAEKHKVALSLMSYATSLYRNYEKYYKGKVFEDERADLKRPDANDNNKCKLDYIRGEWEAFRSHADTCSWLFSDIPPKKNISLKSRLKKDIPPDNMLHKATMEYEDICEEVFFKAAKDGDKLEAHYKSLIAAMKVAISSIERSTANRGWRTAGSMLASLMIPSIIVGVLAYTSYLLIAASQKTPQPAKVELSGSIGALPLDSIVAAEIQQVSRQKELLLFQAVDDNNKQLVQYLIAEGVPVDIKDENKQSLLSHAKSPTMTTLLKHVGAK